MSNKSRREFIKTTSVSVTGAALGTMGVFNPARVLGANDRVRVALVGASDRALGALVPAFMTHAKALNFEIVAVCDIWSKRREEEPAKIATKYGITEPAKVRNTEELYSRKDIDAVIVATADFQHAYHAIEAINAGKDAYVEKPFANMMSDANKALDTIGKSKQVFQVGTQRRSTPSYMAANEYLKSGKFGDIVMAEMTWNVNQPGRWRRPNVVPLLKEADTDWKRYLINRPSEPFDARKYLEFRLFWPYSSGIPCQWLVHQIDTVHWFTGLNNPTSVAANGGIYQWRDGRSNFDTMTAVFDYGDAAKGGKGFQVLYTSRMTNEAGGIKEIYYSNGGTLNLDTNKVTSEGGLKEGPAKAMNMKPNLLPSVTLADEGGVETAADTGRDPQTTAHMKNWMDSVRSRNQKTNADIHAAYNHSVALCMTIAALHTGKRVTFDSKKRDVVTG
jgi:predicted dehydrogenase